MAPPLARFAGGGVYLGTYGAVHGGATNLPRFHWCRIEGNTATWNGEPDVYYFAKDDAFIWHSTVGETPYTPSPTMTHLLMPAPAPGTEQQQPNASQ